MNKNLSIIIPVYNEEKNIHVFYQRIIKVLEQIDLPYECIFINDGSNDNTLKNLNELSDKNKSVKYISLSRNFGHQAALTTGLDHASGDAVITMDCDLQDPPELIIEMIKKWEAGYHIVYARRKYRKDNFLKKYSAIWYYKILDKLSDTKIPKDVGDFRLIDRKVLNELKNMKEKLRYLRGMIAWIGFNYTIIDYERPKRIYGKTGFGLIKMLQLGMAGILNFSLFPIRIGLVIGILTILSGLFFLIYITLDTLIFDKIYPLYKWLSIVTFIFVGFLFVLIWILAEYVGKIYDESKGRPIYIIDEKKNL